MNISTAHYLWDFKNTTPAPIPSECINHNTQFLPDIKIVTPADVEGLLYLFPDLEVLWPKIQHWIIKVDLGRMLYIYANGGFYFDIDCKISKRIDMPKKDFMMLFTEMTVKHISQLGPREIKDPEYRLRIANFAFGTNVVRHPFLLEVMRECIKRLTMLIDESIEKPTDLDILWVCGPDVITTVYHQKKHLFPDLILHNKRHIKHFAYGTWRGEPLP